MDIDKAVELYNKGFALSAIASELGVTRGALSGRISRLRKKSPERFTKREVIEKPKAPKPQPASLHSNKYTFSFKKHSYKTKAEMYQELHEAVKNTK